MLGSVFEDFIIGCYQSGFRSITQNFNVTKYTNASVTDDLFHFRCSQILLINELTDISGQHGLLNFKIENRVPKIGESL